MIVVIAQYTYTVKLKTKTAAIHSKYTSIVSSATYKKEKHWIYTYGDSMFKLHDFVFGVTVVHNKTCFVLQFDL